MSEATQAKTRLAKASVFVGQDDAPFLVAETPREVAHLVHDAEGMVELTLANSGDWNGKPLLVRADCVTAVCPPKTGSEDD